MPDYNTNNTVIYKIYCEDGSCDYVYYGSSISFTKRKWSHKERCNNVNYQNHNNKVYEIIRANGGWDKWKMCVVEIYPCESLTHLRIKEQEYIDLADKTCNTIRSFRNEEEKKEQEKKCIKKYRINNVEKLKEDNKKYRENNVEKIKECHNNRKEKAKEYTRNNRERINEQQRERYRKKREQNTTV